MLFDKVLGKVLFSEIIMYDFSGIDENYCS